MKNHMKPLLYIGITAIGFTQTSFAAQSAWSQEIGQLSKPPIMLAVRVDDRIERRHDAVDNTEDRVDDKQDFREERRDCTGDGADCRSDNRQDKREDTVDRAEDRVDDRQDRL